MPLLENDPHFSNYSVEDRGVTFLLGGPSGIGKTTMCGELIEHFGRLGVAFIDFENKLTPIAHLKPKVWGDGPLTHTRQFWDGITIEQDGTPASFAGWVHSEFKKNGRKNLPTCMVFESLSEHSDMRQRETSQKFSDAQAHKRWGEIGTSGMDTLVIIRRLPIKWKIVNVTMALKPNDFGRRVPQYLLGGNLLPDNLSRKLDEILYMGLFSTKEGEPVRRMIQTGITAEVTCKDSSGLLDPLEEPSWLSIFKKIEDGQKERKNVSQ